MGHSCNVTDSVVIERNTDSIKILAKTGGTAFAIIGRFLVSLKSRLSKYPDGKVCSKRRSLMVNRPIICSLADNQ